MFTVALDMMRSIFSLLYSLALLFQNVETNVFLMLGLPPATTFRLFPPLEQIPENCSDSFIAATSFTSLIALIASMTPPPFFFSIFSHTRAWIRMMVG